MYMYASDLPTRRSRAPLALIRCGNAGGTHWTTARCEPSHSSGAGGGGGGAGGVGDEGDVGGGTRRPAIG